MPQGSFAQAVLCLLLGLPALLLAQSSTHPPNGLVNGTVAGKSPVEF